MGRIHRKIEALEKAASVWRKASERLAQERLGSFSHPETELLISAFGAEQAGRELSAAESAARKAYAQAWKQEVRRRGNPSLRFQHRDYMDHAIMKEVGRRVTLEKLESMGEAMDRGGELSAEESEAFAIYLREMERLSHLAGFPSVVEMELLARRTSGGKR